MGRNVMRVPCCVIVWRNARSSDFGVRSSFGFPHCFQLRMLSLFAPAFAFAIGSIILSGPADQIMTFSLCSKVSEFELEALGLNNPNRPAGLPGCACEILLK